MVVNFRSTLRAAALIVLVVTAAQAQTTKSLTQYMVGEFSYDGCLGFGGAGGTFVIPLWPLGDVLPAGARLRSVSLSWALGNGRYFSWQVFNPVVSFALNGTQLGEAQEIVNYSACYPANASKYTFASADFADGFPGYQNGSTAVNQITMTLTDFGYAGVYPGGPATLTLNYDEESSYFVQLEITTDPGLSETQEKAVTPGGSVAADVSLGSIFAVKLIKKVPGTGGISTIVPITSSYAISGDQINPPLQTQANLFDTSTVVSVSGGASSGLRRSLRCATGSGFSTRMVTR